MSTTRDVEKTARRVNEAVYEISSKQSSFMREVNNIDNWWEGESSKVFQQEYRDINAEINRLVSKMNDLVNELRDLAYEIRRADEERRREVVQK